MQMLPGDNTQMTKTETQKSDLSLEGELKLSDYIQEVEPNDRTRQAVYAWAVQQQEKVKERVLTTLLGLFAGTSVVSFILVGVAIVNPDVDKDFVKSTIPLLIAPQVTLFGGVFGAYVFRSKPQKKQ